MLLTPVLACGAAESSLTEIDGGGMRAGEFVWRPELSPSGPMSMVINLRSQRAYVYRDSVLIGISTISSGKPGHSTPTGTFTVTEKDRVHHSNKYDNAPMPYMERLTSGGVALHGGHLPGYPASHGCIRLPIAFAAALFREPTMGMTVIITNRRPGEENTTVSSNATTRARTHEAVST